MATTRGSRSKKVEQIEVQATLEAARNLDTAKVVSEVNNLQVTLQITLADVSASITNKIQQISTIDDAIALKNARLKELFGIETEAIALDDLKTQREQERLDWQKEQEQHARENAEADKLRKKQLLRDDEEWQYDFDLRRQRAEDTLKAETTENIRTETLRQQELTKEWSTREKSLTAQEVEVGELKKLVEGFDVRLKAEVSKAEAILTNVMKRQYEHEKALLLKDAESAKAVCDMRAQSLQAAIANQQTQLEDLKTQLSSARQDAKEIATNALQAGSDRKVADALRHVVDNRDNQPSKAK